MGAFRQKNLMLPKKPSNILMVKLSALGDTILTVPAIRAVRQQFPEAKITFLGGDTNEGILQRCPYIDQFYVFKKEKSMVDPGYLFNFVGNLRRQSNDLVIHFGQWERLESVLVGLTRGNFKVGFKTERQYKHWIYDSWIEHSKDIHEVENFNNLVRSFGVTTGDGQPEFWISKSDLESARRILHRNELMERRVIVFHPGCGAHGKPREWSINNYVELGERILTYSNNSGIMLTGSSLEKDRCSFIEKRLGKNACSVAGETNLGQTAALLRMSDILVSGNTGIIHLGAAVDTKAVALHGPTSPIEWGPYGGQSTVIKSSKPCAPCLYLGFEYKCRKPDCMDEIGVDEVFDAVRKLFVGI